MTRPFFLLLLLLLPGQLLAQGVYEHVESRYQFPSSLRDFTRKEIHRYSDPRLGVSIAYSKRGIGVLDFYVFDLGLQPVPDGPDSDRVRKAFLSAKRDVREAVRRGYYSNLVESSPPDQMMQLGPGTPRFWETTYKYTVNGGKAPQPVVSWLLLTGARNHFLKVRLTCLASKASEGKRALKAVLIAFFEANGT